MNKPAPRFASEEHQYVGDQVILRDIQGNTLSSTRHPLRFNPTSADQLRYGQILSLGGDYYGVPSAPISDGGSPVWVLEDILASVRTISAAENAIQMLSAIVKILEPLAHSELMLKIDAMLKASVPLLTTPPTARIGDPAVFIAPEELFKLAYQSLQTASFSQEVLPLLDAIKAETPVTSLTEKIDDTAKFNQLTHGKYLALLLTNWDHFGSHAVTAYSAGHKTALQQALIAHQTQKQEHLDLAYAMNAFADHYLSDLFSAGHLRTPRKELAAAFALGSMASNWMHDEDSRNGLSTQNQRGDTWVAYGDDYFSTTANAKNKSLVIEAVQRSADEIWNTFKTGSVPAAYSALYLIPDVTRAQDYTQDHDYKHVNGAAMFIWENSIYQNDPEETKPAIKRRMDYNNVYVWQWSALSESLSEGIDYYRHYRDPIYKRGQTTTINNWFNTTDISVYKATRAEDGTWSHLPNPLFTLKGNEKREVWVTTPGIFLTWWATVKDQNDFGYLPIPEGLEILDVFDIAAGNMPKGYYASWRGLYK